MAGGGILQAAQHLCFGLVPGLRSHASVTPLRGALTQASVAAALKWTRYCQGRAMDRRIATLFVCQLLLWFSAAARCADVFDLGDLYFERIGDERIIPNGVTALAQDADGFIWIGSENGLVRYDGYRYRRFKANPDTPGALAGDFIRSLWLAPDGRLWVGTYADGVSVWDPSTEKFTSFRHRSGDANSLSNDQVDAIAGAADGEVWLGTHDGLDRFDPRTGRFAHYRHDPADPGSLPNNDIRALLARKSGELWIGSRGGLSRFRAGRFERVHSDEGDSGSLAEQIVEALYEDAQGRLWIGTRHGGAAWIDPSSESLHRVIVSQGQSRGLSNPFVEAVVQVGNDIWLGTYGDGITIVDARTGQIRRPVRHDPAIRSSLSFDQIGAFLVGSDGLLWVGTWGGGLSRFNPGNSSFRTLRSSPTRPGALSAPSIRSVTEISSGSIWVGTTGNGIDVIDPSIGVVDGFRADPNVPGTLKSGHIWGIAETSDGVVYVATSEGLHRYRPEDRTFLRFSREDGLIDDTVRALLADANGALWIGTNAGLNRLDPTRGKFETFRYEDRSDEVFMARISVLRETGNGALWVGTNDGLYVLPAGATTLSRIAHDPQKPSSLPHNHVRDLLVTKRGQLWVATDLGFARLQSWDGHNAVFDPVSRHVDDRGPIGVNFLEDAAGRLWSDQGMLDPATWQFRGFGRADAVDIGGSWDGSKAKTRDGTLLFGGSTGLLMVRPDRLSGWTYQPPVRISHASVDGVSRPGSGMRELSLPAGTRGFSIEFSALDYSAPEQIQYTYRLAGYDPDWIPTDAENRRATYTNLDPGDYTFEVRATNRVGDWSPHTLSIKVRQVPYWYQTTPVRLLALALLVALPFLLYQFRGRQILASERRLQAEVESRTRGIGMLSVIGREITESLRLNEVVGCVYVRVRDLVSANAFLIGIYRRDTEMIEISMAMENDTTLPPFVWRMDETDRLAVWCVRYAREVHTRCAADVLRYVGVKLAPLEKTTSMESIVYLPLQVGGQVVGCMSVQREAAGGFDDVQMDMLRTIAAYAAVAIEHALAHEAAELASLTDPLTRLPNRRAFIETARYQASVAARSGKPLSLAIADIDKFKAFNDEYGHDGGDFVLKEVANLLREQLRQQDVVARWGGEEFVFMLPNTSVDDARHVMEKVRAELAARRFEFNGHRFAITSTFGVAAYDWAGDLDAALKSADEALYQGKQKGRNQVVVAEVTKSQGV
ncbi:MAG: diguanylate cyclase [Lysobacteraceae bacterium]|nr:MAG: diguanylate cyclase [Xanthomonadaceae bacterium]